MAQSVTPVSLQFQDINEWVRQQDELDVEKAANDKLATERKENLKPAPISPLTKKVKPLPDIESLAAEKLAMEEMGDENWIGKLQRMLIPHPSLRSYVINIIPEYRDVHPIAGGGITWVEKEAASQLIPRFRCAVLISESAQHFGSTTLGLDSTHVVSFGNKKTAKKYAAKKAVEWLIENNHMPSNGSVKFPKVVTPIPTRPISPKEEGAASYSSQVPELCYRLGFTTPSYVITAAVEHSPMCKSSLFFSLLG